MVVWFIVAFVLAGILAILWLRFLINKHARADADSSTTGKKSLRKKLDTEAITSKQRSTSHKWVEFEVVGYHYLPEAGKEVVRKELKVGDQLQLEPDPTNTQDAHAIKVLFRNKHIGWVAQSFYRKTHLYEALVAGKKIEVTCGRNQRRNSRGINYICAKIKIDDV